VAEEVATKVPDNQEITRKKNSIDLSEEEEEVVLVDVEDSEISKIDTEMRTSMLDLVVV